MISIFSISMKPHRSLVEGYLTMRALQNPQVWNRYSDFLDNTNSFRNVGYRPVESLVNSILYYSIRTHILGKHIFRATRGIHQYSYQLT